MATNYATGERKVAIAKVWMTPGNGEMLINGKTLDQWLGGHDTLKMKVRLPLEATKQLESMNIKATTLGGGYSAQADALKHGITKALVELSHHSERFLSQWVFLLEIVELLSVRNQVRKKREDLRSSQKDSRSLSLYFLQSLFRGFYLFARDFSLATIYPLLFYIPTNINKIKV